MSYSHVQDADHDDAYVSPVSAISHHSHGFVEHLDEVSLSSRVSVPSAEPQRPKGVDNDSRLGGNKRTSSQDFHSRNEKSSDQTTKWQPGFVRRFPFLAILSLLGVLICTIGGIVILIQSDGQDVETWGNSISPSVYLAIVSVIANALLAAALAEGLIISFWNTALKGCTIEELNNNWLCGSSIRHGFYRIWRKGGRVTGVALVFTLLSLLRGPLNQRASQVRNNVPVDTQGTIQLNVAQKLPNGYTGVNTVSRAPIYDTAYLLPAFVDIMKQYSVNSNISMEHSPCGRACTATVKGFGFKSTCTKGMQHWTQNALFSMDIFDASVELYGINGTPNQSQIFEGFSAGIKLYAMYNNGTAPVIDSRNISITQHGDFNTHTCLLQPGIVAYKVRLDGNTISLASDGSDDEFISPTELTSPTKDPGNNTIGGFQYAGSYLFNSSANWVFNGAGSHTTLYGQLPNQQLAQTLTVKNLAGYFSFNDPMPTMLQAMRQIAFRAAVRAAADNATLPLAAQHVPFRGSDARAVYATDRGYMAAAAAVSFAATLAVAATLRGWWRLGRAASLSPLEVARAFEAPLLVGACSNIGWQRGAPPGVLRRRVQFGEVGAGAAAGRLAMRAEQEIARPLPGKEYR